MNPNAVKLARKFKLSMEAAEALVAAGYTTVRKVKDATHAELGKIPGVKSNDVTKIRAKGKA